MVQRLPGHLPEAPPLIDPSTASSRLLWVSSSPRPLPHDLLYIVTLIHRYRIPNVYLAKSKLTLA